MTRRRVGIWIGGGMLLLVIVLALLPYVLGSRVEAGLKAQASKALHAEVNWSGSGLSLFRDFPNLTLRVADLTVTGVGEFEGDTLASVARSRLVLDLGSVLRSLRGGEAVVVRAVELHRPAVRLVVLEDGSASWDIVRADGGAAGEEPGRGFDVSLRRLHIEDGSLSLDDRATGLSASVAGLEQTLRGDFSRRRFVLGTRTTADAVSLSLAGVPYLSRTRLDVRADLDVDVAGQRVTVSDNRIRLNDLELALAGVVGMAGDAPELDLSFESPSTDFGQILSMVPAVYARDFETLETAGTMSVSGWVRGVWSEGELPALAVAAKVADGRFRYADLPLAAREVFLDLSLTNPGGALDGTVLSIDGFRVVLGDDPVEGSLVLRTPVSDPDLDLRLAGRLDLADLGRTFKLEGVEELRGVVVADASVSARLSDVERARYERVDARGGVDVSGLVLRALELPHPLEIDEARLTLSPSHVELASLRGRIGGSDLSMTGRLDNLLGFALRDQELRGRARLVSGRLDLDEWRSEDELQAIAVPADIDFALEVDADRVVFSGLDVRNAHGGARVRDQRLTLDDFRLEVLGGAMAMTGFYETVDPARPTFDLDVSVADLDVPGAFAGLATMRAFAPVAAYASGLVSADLRLTGALTPDMDIVQEVLSAVGSFRTASLRLQDFPPLDKLAAALDLPQLRDPGLVDLYSTLVIRDGRMHVSPFDLRIGTVTMNVAGSNGLDQSLDYTLGLELPRGALGAGADGLVTRMVSGAAGAGVELRPADVISLGVQLGGSITDPSVSTDFRGLAGSAARGAEQALRQEAERRAEDLEQRVDQAADEARRRRAAEAARLIAEGEQRAATIRAEADTLAASVRAEGYRQADALVERAGSPAARLAARAAAERLRKEADDQAERIIREADARASSLVDRARTAAGAPGDTTSTDGD